MYHAVIHEEAMRPRRERWLHARISEHLEGALKREARRRRLPVSMLVRDVLEGALDLVEELVGDGLEVARRARGVPAANGDAAPHAPDEGVGDGIYGWQELVLNRAAACARCAHDLVVGTAAYRALRERPGSPVLLCTDCVGRLRRPARAEKETS